MSYWNQSTEENLKNLVGNTITAIERDTYGDVLLRFKMADGSSMAFIHQQDCCENVTLDDIDGFDDDIVGSPVIMAEEVSNTPSDARNDYDESWTWTFYRIATVKGYMTIKFYGTSNGYYSESVDFVREESA